MLSKSQIRHAFRTNLERSLESGEDRAAFESKSHALAARLVAFFKNETGVWGGFHPLGFEPEISELYALSSHIAWAFPRVEDDSLAFYIPEPGSLIRNQWKILEPNPQRARKVTGRELRGLLIPGLAFDTQCNRLGRGRGYYDRALGQDLKSNNLQKIGVALERQIAESLPIDPHDQAMDRVITDVRTIERKSS